eukprot:Gb_01299 [translate_table: standard]
MPHSGPGKVPASLCSFHLSTHSSGHRER